jgi:hypothetical protein
MRDFRDAKAMAHTLRAALAAKGLKITNSQSLELIAEAFGAADWNTLAAAIRAHGAAPRANAAELSPRIEGIRPNAPQPQCSAALESTLHRALAYANQRDHEYTTLEHLLLALIDDVDASTVMKACDVDIDALSRNLTSYIDNELKGLAVDSGDESKPTAGFQRAVRRAVSQTQELGRDTVTGAQVLVGIFPERESHAAWFLQEQDMTRDDAVHFIVDGVAKRIVKDRGGAGG